MKILSAGDSLLSNADVLDWIKRKRAQHIREDAEDKGRGQKASGRPANFVLALKRHERELLSLKYPYSKNPSAYDGVHRSATFKKFALDAENAIQDHLEQEWRERLVNMTKQQIDKEFARSQDRKCLSDLELLMIFNHAPINTEMLQPMIDNADERFTPDEQQLLVDVVMSTLRCDESDVLANNADS